MFDRFLLYDVCTEVKNFFFYDNEVRKQEYSILDGKFSPLDFLQDGQYFAVFDSVFNDGIYRYNDDEFNGELTDETFEGVIRPLAFPPGFLAMVDNIKEWSDKYSDVVDSPYTSESWDGYSYSKASTGGGSNSTPFITWQKNFSSQLKKWRKIRV